jgi:hypothetical protein
MSAVTPNSQVTPQTPKSSVKNVATLNTTFTTSPTNTQKLVTAGGAGARVTRIQATPAENVTAANLQLYLSKDGGTTKYLFNMAGGGSDTVSGTDAGIPIDFGYSEDNALILEAADEIYCATGISKSFNFLASWGDY